VADTKLVEKDAIRASFCAKFDGALVG